MYGKFSMKRSNSRFFVFAEVSTTQPESSDTSDEGRRRETMVISSDSGSSGDGE